MAEDIFEQPVNDRKSKKSLLYLALGGLIVGGGLLLALNQKSTPGSSYVKPSLQQINNALLSSGALKLSDTFGSFKSIQLSNLTNTAKYSLAMERTYNNIGQTEKITWGNGNTTDILSGTTNIALQNLYTSGTFPLTMDLYDAYYGSIRTNQALMLKVVYPGETVWKAQINLKLVNGIPTPDNLLITRTGPAQPGVVIIKKKEFDKQNYTNFPCHWDYTTLKGDYKLVYLDYNSPSQITIPLTSFANNASIYFKTSLLAVAFDKDLNLQHLNEVEVFNNEKWC